MSTTIPAFNEVRLAQSQRHRVITIPIAIATGTTVASMTYLGTDAAPGILIEPGTAGTLTYATQANIDALLGSTNEVVASAMFGATAMATGTSVGFVLDCAGQIDHVDLVEVAGTVTAGGTATTKLGSGTQTALTNVAITDPQVYVTASGNLAGRANITSISSGTSLGYCVFKIHAIMK